MPSKGKQELDQYIFTRPEMAQLLGISTNALRCRMRKGKCDLEYRFDGNQFKFKRPPRDRLTTMMTDPLRPPMKKPLETTIEKFKRGTIGDLLTKNTVESLVIKENTLSKVLNIITN